MVTLRYRDFVSKLPNLIDPKAFPDGIICFVCLAEKKIINENINKIKVFRKSSVGVPRGNAVSDENNAHIM